MRAALPAGSLGYTDVASMAGGIGMWKPRAGRSSCPIEHARRSPRNPRYARHLVMPEVGPEGQAKLEQSKVLFIGAGGLGSPALLYLAAAGVGNHRHRRLRRRRPVKPPAPGRPRRDRIG